MDQSDMNTAAGQNQRALTITFARVGAVAAMYAWMAYFAPVNLARAQAGLGSCPDSCPDSYTCTGGFCAMHQAEDGTGGTDYCKYPGVGCSSGETVIGDCCCYVTPILIDVSGRGFSLSDVLGGVRFQMGTNGYAQQVSWPTLGSENAWLALDRNGNGKIDNVTELFGNYTSQPPSPSYNGFLALGVFDTPEHGGNNDGIIDQNDSAFSRLRLWIDRNHNGISEPDELLTLSSVGISGLELQYEDAKRIDQYGNRFWLRAKIRRTAISRVGLWAWDVAPRVSN